MEEKQKIEKEKLLVGEGREEELFFAALCAHIGRSDIQIEKYGGKDNLGSCLQALTFRTGFTLLQSVAITRDSNGDAAAALQSVRGAVEAAGMAPPDAHGVFSSGSPRVGAFILPDGSSTGMLEDLCVRALVDDPAVTCIEQYLGCVQDALGATPDPRSKAWVHAWLASRQPPDLRLGEAASRRMLPWTHEAFAVLVAFVRNL